MKHPFQELLGDPGIAVAEGRPASYAGDALFPEEEQAIAKAVAKRRHEFIAGRTLARQAMSSLGVPAQAVPVRDDRAPRWPDGLVGSISHTRDWCVVALGRTSDFAGIGVDVESSDPLKSELWPRVLTEGELATLSNRPPLERARDAKLTFCAKEAAYKAQYSLTEQFLGFQAMEIRVTAPGQFLATLTQDVKEVFRTGHVFEGRYTETHGMFCAAVTIRR